MLTGISYYPLYGKTRGLVALHRERGGSLGLSFKLSIVCPLKRYTVAANEQFALVRRLVRVAIFQRRLYK